MTDELDIEVLPDGLESAYVGEGTLCPKCEEGAIQPGEPCDECGYRMTKQIQYFMTEDKNQRIVNYTLWLEEGEERGKLTFSKRATPDDVWEPPTEMFLHASGPLPISEQDADRILQVEGFTVKEVS